MLAPPRIVKDIPKETILSSIHELAHKLILEYKDDFPILLYVLEGAKPFMNNLYNTIRNIGGFTYQIESMVASSYKGQERISMDKTHISMVSMTPYNLSNVHGRRVLLIEDIVDSGVTMFHVINFLLPFEPKDIKICTLVNRPMNRRVPIDIAWTGFEWITPEFLVGFGMDIDGKFRDLDYIGHVI